MDESHTDRIEDDWDLDDDPVEQPAEQAESYEEPELAAEDEDDSVELMADPAPEAMGPREVHCPHGLVDVLFPAVPPIPANARLIRRLKD